MDPDRRRDGLLATAVLAVLLGLLVRLGELRRLRDPGAALAGIAVGLAVEWLFLRYPERLLGLWDRPVASGGSAFGLSVAALAARGRPRLLAAAWWGLLTYLGLLLRLVAEYQHIMSECD